jgi:LysM domain
MPLNTRRFATSNAMPRLRTTACACAALLALSLGAASAQSLPISTAQRATANQVAEKGVPLTDLSPNAPESHTVKRGDTLWRIAGIFLKQPWRWPELWGMNLTDIRNPHRIYPGQVLYLDKSGGRARLSTRAPGEGDTPTMKVTPRVRAESLSDSAIPPVDMGVIEAFLTEPLIVDEGTFARAPRIVATPESRVLLSLGDRAYARGQYGSGDLNPAEALTLEPGKPRLFRVFRNALPLKDPVTGEVLAYEAQFVGKARLARGEAQRDTETPAQAAARKENKDIYKPQFENTQHNIARVPVPDKKGQGQDPARDIIPATIDIVAAKEEMRVGDRLLPDPPREFPNYVPRAPGQAQAGLIVSVYGNAVRFAAQNQVVAINRGRQHGIEDGHVLAIVRDSFQVTDKTDEGRTLLQLPGEHNGLMMVFRTFDKVSYALVLDIQDGVKVGDRFTSP